MLHLECGWPGSAEWRTARGKSVGHAAISVGIGSRIGVVAKARGGGGGADASGCEYWGWSGPVEMGDCPDKSRIVSSGAGGASTLAARLYGITGSVIVGPGPASRRL